MKRTELKKLIKQINRYDIAVLTVSGREIINAGEFVRSCLLRLARSESILKIEYYKKDNN